MAVIPSLTTFSPSVTIRSADANSNFSAIRTAFNDTAVLTDTARTISVTHTWSASQSFGAGIAVTGTITMATAVSKIVPGAVSFSIRNNADSADNLLVSDAGAVTVRAGLSATTGAFSSTLAVTGGATFSASLIANGGILNFSNYVGTAKIIGGTTGWRVRNVTDAADLIAFDNSGNGSSTGSFVSGTTLTATTGLTVLAGGANITGPVAVTGTLSISSDLLGSGYLRAGSAAAIFWSGSSVLTAPSNGVIKLSNAAESDFVRLQFGGTTSAFPALKRSGATLIVRLADDTGNAGLSVGALTAEAGVTIVTGGLTVTAGGSAITGSSSVTGNLSVTASILPNGGNINFSNYVGTASINGGTTGLKITNNATTLDNLTVSDAGVMTVRGGVVVSAGGVTISAGGATITGNSSVTGTLSVTSTINSQTISAAANFTGTLTVSSTLTAQDALFVQASAYVTGKVDVTGGTVASSTPVLDARQTWNNGAIAFTGIKLDITNTASAATSKLIDLRVGGLPAFSVDRAGSISAGDTCSVNSAYQVSTIQVVGPRKTGWATATGTATRTTFDTATVTTAQLAERVKALIDDLHATAGHGLIGT